MLRPPKFLRLLGMPLVCLAMFSLLGGHWTLLQTVAWTQMLWNYSQQSGSLVVGMEKTFDGRNPCKFCHKVTEGQQKEQKAPATVKTDKKIETLLSVATAPLAPLRTGTHRYSILAVSQPPTRSDAPPSPVPRSLS